MAELQAIPARHGTATFVPAGQTIKIINTSGTQVVDTWAFALPNPEPKKGSEEEQQAQKQDQKQDQQQEQKEEPSQSEALKSAPAKAKKKGGSDFPSQEDAEKATQEGIKEGEEKAAQDGKPKSSWSSYVPTSYVPSMGWSSKKDGSNQSGKETEQQKNSRTWGSYFPSGKGFSNYIPKQATDTVSSFADTHQRDPNKSYLEQLTEFSKTPVGAAGMAALTGSGYSGSLYAGYQAYNSKQPFQPAMEFMSMPHSRAATLHLRPRVDDTLVSNIREPIMTLVEDTSPGIHDTLIAACDPARYKGLGVENWEQHGSCAENLVLALKELNERAGLKGNKGVGAEVTINSVPAPLNLFMNIPWDEDGDIGFHAPKGKKGDYVRLKAERDIVVVMSACPQDVLDINGKDPQDAHFLVEGGEEPKQAIKRTQKKRPPPRKINSSHATSTQGTESGAQPAKKPVPQKRPVPAKKPATSGTSAPAKKPAPSGASSTGQGATKQTSQAAPAPKKKPAPKPVQPQKTAEAPSTGEANGGDAAPPPVEKKKPRKLAPKAKPAAAGDS
ncbi:uncharacterized protein LTR77_001340 [Saxophila tyrrhenica]|uniref:DUF1989 domain-containing protein n=1 Tax=Saxophila tyrrhenica TaxID=1690608 RepID=A0AAV9PKU0_9PEZI|nr:hypothetical protein LTR77_001340 [Saxophila tyrrhenica]